MTQAIKTNGTFRMTCSIRAAIAATPERVWALLTDAGGFTRWNSTVARLDGTIAEGERLALEARSAPGRTFRPRVTRFEPARAMEWSEGTAPFFRGVRTFTLAPRSDGGTDFTMTEELAGIMLPLVKNALPDFGPVFERYARDLSRAADASVGG